MSQTSAYLSLPYIQGGQAQKHVTHNEALRALDTIVHLSVLAQTSDPDPAANSGDRFIVAANGTGAFSGHNHEVAVFEGGAWTFHVPRAGWIAYDESASKPVVFDGTAWVDVTGESAARLGVNGTADDTNRLVVASDAVLLTHDTNGDHQVKVNKQSAGDTASLVFQTGYSGRAEFGLAGTDNFSVKVSADGASFVTALEVDGANGSVSFPETEFSDPAFGGSTLITRRYENARTVGKIANATGALGNGYNFPAATSFDAVQTPDLPAAFSKAGYFTGQDEMAESIAVDPNKTYRMGAYLRQEGVPGDWSAFANEDRHIQHMGLQCIDTDGLAINAEHHMRYRHGGIDSLTTLTQPLAPGDTTIHVADAAGWNESEADGNHRGLIIFGHADNHGRVNPFYSRIEQGDLFDLGDVNKGTGVITLNGSLPLGLGNPDDAGGVWPAGTRIANRSTGWSVKLALCEDHVPAATDTWYYLENAIGGIDQSGTNARQNFAPGTASVRPVWMVNYSNRSGGWFGYPDTGASQSVWVGGLSFDVDVTGRAVRQVQGDCTVHVVNADPGTGTVSMSATSLSVRGLA